MCQMPSFNTQSVSLNCGYLKKGCFVGFEPHTFGSMQHLLTTTLLRITTGDLTEVRQKLTYH